MFTQQHFKLRINLNLKDISNAGGKRSQIMLTTTIDGQRVRIYTKLLVHKEHWIPSDRSASQAGGYVREDNSLDRVTLRQNKRINKEIRKILGYCEEYVQLVTNNSLLASSTNTIEYSKESFIDFMKTRIDGNDYMQRLQFASFVENYIEQKQSDVNPHTRRILSVGTISNHKNALRRLKEFAATKNITLCWGLFTKDFERVFTAWMNEKGYTPNTIAAQYSILKVWLSDAENKGLISDKAFHHYCTTPINVENIYLSEDEINRIYDYDLSDLVANGQSQIEETRDLFIIGCWTGLRYSDYASLPIIDDTNRNSNSDEPPMIEVSVKKTGKSVSIPLHPHVLAIYNKYNGQLPKPIDKGKAMKHIRAIARKAGITQNVTITSTEGGRRVVKTMAKCDFIVNHTARRSFATNMYLKKAPILSIMAITGHTTETNFMKYIKLDANEHAKIIAKSFKQTSIAS